MFEISDNHVCATEEDLLLFLYGRRFNVILLFMFSNFLICMPYGSVNRKNYPTNFITLLCHK